MKHLTIFLYSPPPPPKLDSEAGVSVVSTAGGGGSFALPAAVQVLTGHRVALPLGHASCLSLGWARGSWSELLQESSKELPVHLPFLLPEWRTRVSFLE